MSKRSKLEFVFEPRNRKQKEYKEILELPLEDMKILMTEGPGGSCKTLGAVYSAVRSLKSGEVSKIVITRPMILAEDFGYLPGDMNKKIEPLLMPMFQAFEKVTGQEYEQWLDDGRLEIYPIAFMRGINLENCVVIVDEAQNVDVVNFRMILTRIAENCRIIFNFDCDQIDLKNKNRSASKFIDAFMDREDDCIFVFTFTEADCFRSKICRTVLKIFKEFEDDFSKSINDNRRFS